MKNVKQIIYIPPRLTVVEFRLEQGYENSGLGPAADLGSIFLESRTISNTYWGNQDENYWYESN